MLSPSTFREIVSGRRRDAGARLLRAALRVAETPYSLAVRWRNRRYDTGRASTGSAGVPLVSVGNLTLGGTGKTPMVEWLARWFRRRDVRLTLISRGYGAEAGSKNDEALELEQRLPDVPHLQNPDRLEAAATAVEEFDCQLIVLDDAFQHRRIQRDLDIVMIDALEPFGFEHVFPRGTLREPLCGLRRADILALARADMLSRDQRAELRRRFAKLAPQALWTEVFHAPRELVAADSPPRPVDSLRDHPVAAFCGVGAPAGFRHTLDACGYRVVAFREFDDHHPYDRHDLKRLADWADSLDVQAVVCTCKDLVKIRVDHLGRRPLRAVSIGLDFLVGQKELEERLERLLPGGA